MKCDPDNSGTRANVAVSLIAGALVAVYLTAALQHPIFNFDDLAFLYSFSAKAQTGWLQGARDVFLAADLPSEYRLYSLSRLLHYLIWTFAARDPFPYYLVMALTWVVGAVLIYLIVARLENAGSRPSRAGLGVAAIWLFSPFSLCRTFHFWSYLILPAVLLLGYVYLSLTDRAPRLRIFLVPIITLCGEVTIVPLGLCIVLLNWHVRRRALIHFLLFACVLIGHFTLLHAIHDYPNERFSWKHFDSLASLSYFLSSVRSTVARAFQLSVQSYEPYFSGVHLHGWAWHSLTGGFFVLATALGLCCFFLWQRSFRTTLSPKRIVAATIIVGAMWALFIVMVFTTQLYGKPFALQVRYGYAVLPLTFGLLFLVSQQFGAVIRIVGMLIPIVLMLGWSLNVAVVQPAQAHVDANVLQMLKEARAANVDAISILEPDSIHGAGIVNPYLITADTPFQQGWTSGFYFFIAQKLETGVGIDSERNGIADMTNLGGFAFSCPLNKVVVFSAAQSTDMPRPPTSRRLASVGAEEAGKCSFSPEDWNAKARQLIRDQNLDADREPPFSIYYNK